MLHSNEKAFKVGLVVKSQINIPRLANPSCGQVSNNLFFSLTLHFCYIQQSMAQLELSLHESARSHQRWLDWREHTHLGAHGLQPASLTYNAGALVIEAIHLG